MSRLYKVTLCYENIESGGSTRFETSYTLEAKNGADAVMKGEEKLGCNRDGKLFWVKVERIYIDK